MRAGELYFVPLVMVLLAAGHITASQAEPQERISNLRTLTLIQLPTSSPTVGPTQSSAPTVLVIPTQSPTFGPTEGSEISGGLVAVLALLGSFVGGVCVHLFLKNKRTSGVRSPSINPLNSVLFKKNKRDNEFVEERLHDAGFYSSSKDGKERRLSSQTTYSMTGPSSPKLNYSKQEPGSPSLGSPSVLRSPREEASKRDHRVSLQSIASVLSNSGMGPTPTRERSNTSGALRKERRLSPFSSATQLRPESSRSMHYAVQATLPRASSALPSSPVPPPSPPPSSPAQPPVKREGAMVLIPPLRITRFI